LQDIKEFAPNFQGNGSSGNTSDEEVAFRSYKSELESRIRAYQCVAYRFPREVQAAMSLAMTGPPQLAIRTVPRITAAIAPISGAAAATVEPTETPLAAEAAGCVTPAAAYTQDLLSSNLSSIKESTTEAAGSIIPPPAVASSQTSSPVSRSSSTSSAESSQANALSDSANAKVSDQEQNTVSPVIVPRSTYRLWSLAK
jgi:hypothetical protein